MLFIRITKRVLRDRLIGALREVPWVSPSGRLKTTPLTPWQQGVKSRRYTRNSGLTSREGEGSQTLSVGCKAQLTTTVEFATNVWDAALPGPWELENSRHSE